jgi:hypothetical protein
VFWWCDYLLRGGCSKEKQHKKTEAPHKKGTTKRTQQTKNPHPGARQEYDKYSILKTA